MIKRYHHVGLGLFIPGAILQFAGMYLLRDEHLEKNLALAALGMALGGALLAVVGLAFYAKAKGHSFVYGLLGFMGIFGIIAQSALKDESGDPWNTAD